MFKQAQIKLTIVYSLLFLVLFSVFSSGLYFWMSRSFGTDYVDEVKQRQSEATDSEINDQNNDLLLTAGEVALNQLKVVMLVLNGGLLIIIPLASWFLARNSLRPVQVVHEQQKRFVSDASHELRTPLSIMNGEIEIALKKNRSSSDYRQILISAKEEINRLTRLVENLLFLAREDQRKTKFEKTPVDLTELIDNVIVHFSSQIKDKGLTLNFNSPDNSLTVAGDPTLLFECLANLIDNAIKYNKNSGRIGITLMNKDRMAAIEIKDNGRGIEPEQLDKIFDRFYQVDKSRSQKSGYGLGLAICKTIVEQHHGNIAVSSIVGKGSIFTVKLPITI